MSEDILIGPNDEEAEEATLLSGPQIADFWREFAAQLPTLAAMSQHEFVEHGNVILSRHAPELAVELEKDPGSNAARIVITSHGNLDQFENAQALVRQAPPLPGHTVQAFRNRAQGSDFSMNMDNFSLSCSDVLVAHYDAGGVVGLEMSFEKIIPQEMMEHARHMAFIMLDHVLGEWDFAVRVGPVEFVDAFSEDVDGAEPLSVFPAIFDEFVRDGLGRSNRFPSDGGDDDQWASFEVRRQDAADDAPPDLLTFRLSANAVATRADMPYYMEWRLGFESQEELDNARDACDALQSRMEQHHSGILVYTRVEDMSARVAAFYVEDAQAATHLAQQMGEQFAPQQSEEVSTMFDPSWQEYLGIYNAVQPRDQDED